MASLVGFEAAMADADAATAADAVARAALLHAAILAFGGVPLLFMGDEIALTNDRDYARRGTGNDGRWLHRPFMDWQRVRTLEHSDAPFAAFHARLRGLIAARRRLDVLHAANATHVVQGGAPEVLAFVRESSAEKLLFLGNFSGRRVTWQPPAGNAVDLPCRARDAMSGNAVVLDHPLDLGPYAVLWLHSTL
ncbi:MAG: hypothetical protein D6782_10715 [Alphaproteobacteria bacterium]|nr:MAG: hypothetical protein D6782_10715 [Alphaproteobacteria bacterium]